MSRKKVFLSIFLFLFLILISIILPSLWKMDKEKNEKEPKVSEKKLPDSIQTKAEALKLEFANFESLEQFLASGQIASLKEQFTMYLEEKAFYGAISLNFLPEKTDYPDKNTTCFYFQLSDGTHLPVYNDTSHGVYFFGDEKVQISSATDIYEKPKNDELPSVTTGEIETRMEGGYADTKNSAAVPEYITDSATPEESNPDTKEVQP